MGSERIMTVKKNILIGLGAGCIALCVCNARAEELFDVLAQTYQTNPALQSAQAYLRAVDERVGQAKSGWRPIITLDGNATHAEQKFKNYPGTADFDYDNNQYEAGVTLVQPVFSGFKTVSAVDLAEKTVFATREQTRQTEQQVLLSAAVASVDVIQSRALLDLQKNQEQVLNRHYKSYQKRLKVGDLTGTDVAQSEARLKGAVAARINAQGNLETSVAAFESIVGRKPAENITINEIDSFMPGTLQEVLDAVKQQNPSLKAAEYAMQAAKENVSLQKGDVMPSVNVIVGAGYQWAQPLPQIDDHYDGRYWRVGANLSIPLYQGGGEYAKIREAKELENQARINYTQVLRELTMNATQAWETYQATKASIDAIKAQIKASKMALDGVIREADVGSRTVLDVLDAEQEYLNYRVNLVSAERNMTVAALNVLASMGKMTAESLKLKVDIYSYEEHYDDVKNKIIGTGI